MIYPNRCQSPHRSSIAMVVVPAAMRHFPALRMAILVFILQRQGQLLEKNIQQKNTNFQNTCKTNRIHNLNQNKAYLKNELFEYPEQKIFEHYWLCKTYQQ